jgi:hypothetical protein
MNQPHQHERSAPMQGPPPRADQVKAGLGHSPATTSGPPPQPQNGAPGGESGAAAPAAPQAAKRVAAPLTEARWSLREHKDSQHWVCLDRDTPYEAVFEPQFWANIARRFKQSGETIMVTNDQRTVFAMLIVLQFGPNWARVGEWYKKTAEQLVQTAPNAGSAEQYRVEDGGPIDRWRVLRLSDQAIVAKGLENEASAYAYLANMLKRSGRG